MNCDPLARWYRTLEYLGMGRTLERRRSAFLSELAAKQTSGRALLLGDGDGRFLAALLANHPAVRADYVDNSAAMVASARRRLVGLLGKGETKRRTEFHCADALDWSPPPGRSYGLVITHFFLDCLTEPQIDTLLSRLDAFVEPNATWIVSEFHQPASGFAAWRARVWISGLYRLFGWATGLRVRRLPDYRARLKAHGYRLEKAVTANLELLVSERWRRDQ